jgi:hypothetical protein
VPLLPVAFLIVRVLLEILYRIEGGRGTVMKLSRDPLCHSCGHIKAESLIETIPDRTSPRG